MLNPPTQVSQYTLLGCSGICKQMLLFHPGGTGEAFSSLGAKVEVWKLT